MDRALMACGAAPSLQKCFHVTALLLVTNTQTKKTEINHHIWISHLFLELFLFFWCVYYIFRSYLLRDFFLSFLLVLSQLLTLWTEGTSLFAVSDILASSAFAVFRSLKLQPWPLSHLPLSYSIFDKKNLQLSTIPSLLEEWVSSFFSQTVICELSGWSVSYHSFPVFVRMPQTVPMPDSKFDLQSTLWLTLVGSLMSGWYRLK